MKTEDIFSEFAKPIKKPWLEKIKEELGTKYDQLVLENIGTSPIQHFEDKLSFNINDLKKNNTAFICEEISGINNAEINKNILTALEGGANSIKISVQFLWSIQDFEEIFKDVYLTYIFIIFNIEIDEFFKAEFIQYFKKYLEENKINLSEINGQLIIKNNNNFRPIVEGFKGFRFINVSTSKKIEPTKQLTDLLTLTENKLSNFTNKDLQQNYVKSLVFDLNLSNHFFKNIAIIKALKILWANILKAYDLDYYIFIKIKINTTSILDKNIAIIAATNQALSAKIGGVNLLEITKFIHNIPGFSPTFSNRIARNIQNILELESHMNNVNDPSNGSYFIDNLTKNICEKTWVEFQKNHIK